MNLRWSEGHSQGISQYLFLVVRSEPHACRKLASRGLIGAGRKVQIACFLFSRVLNKSSIVLKAMPMNLKCMLPPAFYEVAQSWAICVPQ